MYYGEIKTNDIANGEGVRTTLFVSGCTRHCKNCFNKKTWDFNFGNPFTEDVLEYILKESSPDWIQGLTILGGEPMEFINQQGLYPLLKEFKARYPKKDIWLFTGFTYDEDLIPNGQRYGDYTDKVLDLVDILVDGRFLEELHDITLQFRGSSNQRVIDLKKTRATNQIHIWEKLKK